MSSGSRSSSRTSSSSLRAQARRWSGLRPARSVTATSRTWRAIGADPCPPVYGHEAAGVVAEVGADVESVVPGDHVVVTLVRSCGRCYLCRPGEPALCSASFPLDERGPLRSLDGRQIRQGLRTGAFAECVTVDASQVVPIADDVPMESASLLACGVLTGVGAVVNAARVSAASSVAVVGTGGVGLNSVQGAVLAGAVPVIAIDLADAKLALAFGATHAVN